MKDSKIEEMPAEKPILFSGEMVRAILDGKKTQTRRPIDFRRIAKRSGCTRGKLAWSALLNGWAVFDGDCEAHLSAVECPLGKVGDRLWVRETWGRWSSCKCGLCTETLPVHYKATWSGKPVDRWHPSIHMRRADSRITLEITAVRVERLRDISEEDAKAEGVAIKTDAKIAAEFLKLKGDNTWGPAKLEFWHLWESLYGKGAWEKNPWLWVLSFRRIKP